ncbi:MAG: hypothetical protein ACK55I_12440, partial [bacterium]
GIHRGTQLGIRRVVTEAVEAGREWGTLAKACNRERDRHGGKPLIAAPSIATHHRVDAEVELGEALGQPREVGGGRLGRSVDRVEPRATASQRQGEGGNQGDSSLHPLTLHA